MAAEVNITKAAVVFNLTSSSLQNKIAKMVNGNEVRAPTFLLQRQLSCEPKCFMTLNV